MKLSNYYSTSDIACATTLSLFFPLDNIDKSNPQKAVFNFIKNDELIILLEIYWRRELKVEPQAYFQQLKFIKSRLYEQS